MVTDPAIPHLIGGVCCDVVHVDLGVRHATGRRTSICGVGGGDRTRHEGNEMGGAAVGGKKDGLSVSDIVHCDLDEEEGDGEQYPRYELHSRDAP